MADSVGTKLAYSGSLKDTKEKFRTYFLLLFTKELIKHSTGDFFRLEHTLRKKELKKAKTSVPIPSPKNDTGEYILSLMHRHPRPAFEHELRGPAPSLFKKELMRKPQLPAPVLLPRRRPLVIPDQPLPPQLQYLRPYPTNVPIDLGALEPLGQDPAVQIIECDGPNEPIRVKGAMGAKPTRIILGKEDIDSLLERFSQQAKIPLTEGVHKIVLGKYILSAIVSEVIGSKFIIRKMAPQFGLPSFV